MKLYEKFSGEDLKVAEKIQQRRLQILVHSYIYYQLDQNIVSDHKWAQWGKELAELQNKHDSIAKEVIYHEDFIDFDGSTGAFLPYMDKQIIDIADRLLHKSNPVIIIPKKAAPVKKQATSAMNLF